jgi:uncharacterized protein YndB with AHSA1/START domain
VTTLVVRRTIRATPDVLFAAWTEPAHLVNWWGPTGVECIDAAVDLRVGGAYRIANRFPDGNVVWIRGTFETIERPRLIAYTWQLESATAPMPPERVTVRFDARDDGTEVVIQHERIANDTARRGHELGWEGCLDGLADYVRRAQR